VGMQCCLVRREVCVCVVGTCIRFLEEYICIGAARRRWRVMFLSFPVWRSPWIAAGRCLHAGGGL